MGLKAFGTMAVDWEQRVDFDRLRRQRLARAKRTVGGPLPGIRETQSHLNAGGDGSVERVVAAARLEGAAVDR